MTIFIITFIIYITGYIAAYYLLRYDYRKSFPNSYDWSDVFFIAAISLLSWMTFLALAPQIINLNLKQRIKNKFPKNPPKWL